MNKCSTCKNRGWETMSAVAACNCCEDGDNYNWNGTYWAGCNYFKNTGKTPDEILGTATAMHDCDNCNILPYCKVKQTSEIFKLDEAVIALNWNITMTEAKMRRHDV